VAAAISSIRAPLSPLSANSVVATSRISAIVRAGSLVREGALRFCTGSFIWAVYFETCKNSPAMRDNTESSFNTTVLVLALCAGLLYSVTHMLNAWLFKQLEFSEHISFLYLPSFLRLANVLVLGMVWGTLGTAIGGILLLFTITWQETWFVSIANIVVSAGTAALSIVVMQLLQKRKLSLTRLSDLLQLALLHALINSLAHHAVWSMLDPSLLTDVNQLPYMLVGDMNGAIVGALILRWVARHTPIVALARQRALQDEA
jgi:hypothetical protein